MKKTALFTAMGFFWGTAAMATTFTLTSPTGAALPGAVSAVGGVVVDMVGTNGTHVVSQLAASSLFEGFYDGGSPAAFNGNPGTIGIQSGFTSAVTDALGGGLAGMALRFTLWDGDSAAGDFDAGDNTLLVNGTTFGGWSSVNAENTDSLGNAGVYGFSGGGFRDSILDTGWFYSTDAGALAAIYGALVSTQTLTFQVSDRDPYDNFYDFTMGIDAGLIDVGTGPIVNPGTPTVPEPGTMLLLGSGLLGLAGLGRRRSKK